MMYSSSRPILLFLFSLASVAPAQKSQLSLDIRLLSSLLGNPPINLLGFASLLIRFPISLDIPNLPLIRLWSFSIGLDSLSSLKAQLTGSSGLGDLSSLGNLNDIGNLSDLSSLSDSDFTSVLLLEKQQEVNGYQRMK